jgi:hypothetical protein
MDQGFLWQLLTLERPISTRLASCSQPGFDTNLSHPILKTKSNVESYVCPGISHIHKTTNYNVSSLEFITYRIIIHT